MSLKPDILSLEAFARAGRASVEIKTGAMDAGDAVVSTRLHCEDEQRFRVFHKEHFKSD